MQSIEAPTDHTAVFRYCLQWQEKAEILQQQLGEQCSKDPSIAAAPQPLLELGMADDLDDLRACGQAELEEQVPAQHAEVVKDSSSSKGASSFGLGCGDMASSWRISTSLTQLPELGQE